MKINKKNPEHLKALAISAAYSLAAAIARPFIKRKEPHNKIIIFYGHTLNGNLKAFYDFLINTKGYRPYFLVLDKHYLRRLKATSNHPDTMLSALSLSDMMQVARADAFITSHGLHLMSILRALSNIKFIDVWHAISYKGFDYKDFGHLRAHDETWVSSEYIRKMYIKRFGFKPHQVKITGYGRADQLINGSLNKSEIIQRYKIPEAKKYILIAPTWKQDVSGRSVLPFGLPDDIFFGELDALAKEHNAQIIFRTHLNSNDDVNVSHLSNTSFMPYGKYEVVEDFLFITNILVTDWSSVGIDFLPLKRPAIFLDVPAPFKKGFELGPEHRYGDIVHSLEELKQSLEKYLQAPQKFLSAHGKDIERTTQIAYGTSLDGKSVERYLKNLNRILDL